MGAEAKTMDIKKNQIASTESSLSSHKVKDFVSDIKSEIYKVHWTSREELLAYTKIVIIATLTFGMAIYFVDMIIQTVLNGLSFLIQAIIG